ncbi:MAG: hypothetical protein RMX96_01670 [Nostoc sp. ChiSLP02]|nr:hypothetical protein [Nostoc sp. ChiSLP02]
MTNVRCEQAIASEQQQTTPNIPIIIKSSPTIAFINKLTLSGNT